MTNKRLYILTGLVGLFFSLLGLKLNIDSYEVQKSGKLIIVKVIYVPNCIGTKIKKHFRFQYMENGQLKESSKRIGGKL